MAKKDVLFLTETSDPASRVLAVFPYIVDKDGRAFYCFENEDFQVEVGYKSMLDFPYYRAKKDHYDRLECKLVEMLGELEVLRGKPDTNRMIEAIEAAQGIRIEGESEERTLLRKLLSEVQDGDPFNPSGIAVEVEQFLEKPFDAIAHAKKVLTDAGYVPVFISPQDLQERVVANQREASNEDILALAALIEHNHDMEIGVTWDVIDNAISELCLEATDSEFTEDAEG